MWKMLIVTVIFGNGAYFTDYVGLQHKDGGEVLFKTEAECLDQVDRVGLRARTTEWVPARKTRGLPLGGVCLPASLAEFTRTAAKPRVTLDKVKEFTLPAGVLSDYTPPAPPPQGQPGAAAPAPATPAPVLSAPPPSTTTR